MKHVVIAFSAIALLLCIPPVAAAAPSVDEARAALRRAATFFHGHVAHHGGYVYQYSGDLTLREGEGKADQTTIWVQPPGTPAVGEAMLDAYDATGEKFYRDAARDAARALVQGQLHSGGWTYYVRFDAERRATVDYRYDLHWRPTPDPVRPADRAASGGWHVWRTRTYKGNVTTLDDDTTQAALRFLMRLDRADGFENRAVNEATRYGLAALLATQYPNGAWSANFDRFPLAAPSEHDYPPRKANYPNAWPRSWPKDFTGCYATNDDLAANTIRTMLAAWRIYGDRRYLESARRGGRFLIDAQMPSPQPAWAQQYNRHLQPVWDRAFEPPAISGRESQTILETLLALYDATGEQAFLEPVPAALAYLRRSLLPDGRLARFFELRTNRPLYFTRDADGRHRMTYDADSLATNYAFVVDSRLDEIYAAYLRAAQAGNAPPAEAPESFDELAAEAREVIDGLDRRGAWVERGRLRHHKIEPESGVIRSATFIDNVGALCRFIKRCEGDAAARRPTAVPLE